MEGRPQAFNNHSSPAPKGLIVMDGAKELGEKVNNYLVRWSESNTQNFIIDCACPRFSSGDSKGLIRETVRGLDLYFLVDIGNYNCTYDLFNQPNRMSPDDHYQDLKRLIQAVGGKAYRISIIMPLIYGGRQHRRNYRESLDCACMLQELKAMGVSNIVTFDAHDSRVQNAVPLVGFDNVMPYYQVIKTLIKTIPDINFDNNSFMLCSPDEGAMSRNIYYSSVLGVDLGMFYKRRDYSKIVNGRNPIVAHEYLGAPVEGKDIFIVDDIISSGDSMLDIATALKAKGAKRILCNSTYAIFTNGLESFDKAYNDNLIDAVFGTNLTYCTPQLAAREWYHTVEVSKYIAYFIESLNRDMSVSEAIDPHEKIKKIVDKHNSNTF